MNWSREDSEAKNGPKDKKMLQVGERGKEGRRKEEEEGTTGETPVRKQRRRHFRRLGKDRQTPISAMNPCIQLGVPPPPSLLFWFFILALPSSPLLIFSKPWGGSVGLTRYLYPRLPPSSSLLSCLLPPPTPSISSLVSFTTHLCTYRLNNVQSCIKSQHAMRRGLGLAVKGWRIIHFHVPTRT